MYLYEYIFAILFSILIDIGMGNPCIFNTCIAVF